MPLVSCTLSIHASGKDVYVPTSGTTLSSVPSPCGQCTHRDMTCVEVGTQIHGWISPSNMVGVTDRQTSKTV